MRRHLCRPCKRHDYHRQPTQSDIFPCSLYGHSLFFPVQIRRTFKTNILSTLIYRGLLRLCISLLGLSFLILIVNFHGRITSISISEVSDL